MTKKTVFSCAYLRVDIVKPRNPEPEFWLSTARTLREQIKRHCEDIESISVESERDAFCEFCGDPWTESDGVYNGGCCNQDEAQDDH